MFGGQPGSRCHDPHLSLRESPSQRNDILYIPERVALLNSLGEGSNLESAGQLEPAGVLVGHMRWSEGV